MKKKFLSLAVACSLLAAVGGTSMTANAVEAEEKAAQAVASEEVLGAAVDDEESTAATVYGYYNETLKYRVDDDGTIIVIKYSGKDESYTVPSKIDGKPVKAVLGFSGCGTLKSVTISEGITEIGQDAFSNCKNLEKVNLPKTVTKIGSFAFYGCTSMKSFTIPENVTWISSDTFAHCTALTSITVPSGVTGIHDDAFKYCAALKEVNLSEGLEKIFVGAFDHCTSLRSIYIPKTVKSIEISAFRGCTNLRGVAFANDDVSYEPTWIFRDCPKLTIYGNIGSRSETYASESKIPFKPLSDFENDMNNGKAGDVDDDGHITSADALLILRYSVNLEYFTEREKKLANVDGDGIISSSDSLTVLRYSVGYRDKDTLIK